MLRSLPPTFKPVNNLICCKTGLMWVAKRATSLFNLLYSNVARQVARFLLQVFTHLYLFNWRVHLVRYWTHCICFGLFSYWYTLLVIVLKIVGWLLLKCSTMIGMQDLMETNPIVELHTFWHFTKEQLRPIDVSSNNNLPSALLEFPSSRLVNNTYNP